MAYQQTQSGTQQVEAMSDLNYDLVTTLAECMDSVYVLNTYLEDAREAGNKEAEQVFDQIRQDELRHCQMLKQAISQQCQNGQFK